MFSVIHFHYFICSAVYCNNSISYICMLLFCIPSKLALINLILCHFLYKFNFVSSFFNFFEVAQGLLLFCFDDLFSFYEKSLSEYKFNLPVNSLCSWFSCRNWFIIGVWINNSCVVGIMSERFTQEVAEMHLELWESVFVHMQEMLSICRANLRCETLNYLEWHYWYYLHIPSHLPFFCADLQYQASWDTPFCCWQRSWLVCVDTGFLPAFKACFLRCRHIEIDWWTSFTVASILIPGGHSLRPLKNRGKGEVLIIL